MAKTSRLQRNERRAALLFVSPWIIGFLIFTAGPMVASLFLSFTDYTLVQAPEPVGAANYQQLLSDPRVAKSLANTFVYALLFVPLGTVVSLGLAMMLLRVGRAAGFFRTAFYLPVMTPAVAAAAMFLLLLNGQRGLVNEVLGWVGIDGPNWTTDPSWLKPSLAMVSLWSMGGSIAIFLAALKNVPHQLYEAAVLDGAGAVRRFRNVTLPMISGTIFFIVITHTISAMQMFDEAYTMFYGPQQKATASDESLVYMVYLFQQAFQFFKMGFASAMAWVLFVIILVITAIQVRVGNRFSTTKGVPRDDLPRDDGADTEGPGGGLSGAAGADARPAVPAPRPGDRVEDPLLHPARPCRDGLRLPLGLARQCLAQAQGPGLRQPVDPGDRAPAELRRGVVGRTGPAVAPQLRRRRPHGGHHGDPLQRARGVRLCLLPLPVPRSAVRAGPRHDDAAGCGDDDPRLPDLEQPRHGQHPGPALGAEPLRVGVLHLPAPAVLPRGAAGAVRGGTRRRVQLLRAVLAHRRPPVPAGVAHRVRLRAAGQLVGPDEAADLPAEPGLLHDAAGSSRSWTPLRSPASTTGRSPWRPASSPPSR